MALYKCRPFTIWAEVENATQNYKQAATPSTTQYKEKEKYYQEEFIVERKNKETYSQD